MKYVARGPRDVDEEKLEVKDGNVLKHYGTPRHSGRYPWGSGKNPQRSKHFLQRAKELSDQGLSDMEIAKAFGLSSGDYRAIRKNYVYEQKMENQMMAIKLRDKGMSQTAIAERLGVSEGTVRNMLDPNKKMRENRVANVANTLKDIMKEKPYLDVGEGVARQLNISEETMHAALLRLQDEGYNVLPYNLPQVSNPRQYTEMKVLCSGDTTRADLKANLIKITSPDGLYFEDYGETTKKLKPIPSIDSKRISVKYDEEDGGLKDGLIEIRPGTEDLSLGGRRYAQVRIGVDGTHYLKGVAAYGDPKEMPPGVDIVFNTSKHKGTPMTGKGDNTVLKEMKSDPQNPFGATFRQWDYQDKNGESHPSPVNIVNDDTDWGGWKNNLSSQFLSKQLPSLAKKQLDVRYGEMADEFAELKSLTNPTLKRQLCEEFADDCDAAAVHLKAAALPRQGAFAILPVNTLKDNEVYAPMYDTGEEVILVRHPHEGVFQIPRLIVNNDNKEGNRMIGNEAQHAIGINAKTANQLSGADYDGDTVLVIPTKGQKLKSAPPLAELKDYNPSDYYSRDPDDPMVTGKSRDGKKGDGFNKGLEMGKASNLITDMTLQGASLEKIGRAVKYSMCVIDAEKHNLDWKRAYRDNGIEDLKEEFQARVDPETGNVHYGAATLISRSKNPIQIPERKEIYGRSQMTDEEKARYDQGEIIYRETGRKYKDPKTGKIKPATETIERMAAAKDAYDLSSGYIMENIYAEHANRLKALGNEARKEARNTGLLELNKSAAKAYDDVVGKEGTLTKKIRRAELEAPKERQAQIIASHIMKTKIEAMPELADKDNRDKRRKLSAKALEEARDIVHDGHSSRYRIELSDREWEAIQAGAISDNKFKRVLRYSDTNKIKQRALPRNNTGIKTSTLSRARILLNNGYALSTVAKELGVSAKQLGRELGVAENDLPKGGE